MFRIKTFLLFLTTSLFAQVSQAAGLLTPIGSSESLDIKSHNVEVTADHSFAVIEIEQVFSNPHTAPLEAIYSFPVPEQASVGEFTYWINGTPVHAEVLERKEARQVYEDQKAQGRNAALVEKNTFIDFQISVSQVQPGQDVRIKLVYIQPVNVDHGIARFVYPLESGGTDEVQKAFWTANEVVQQDFEFNFALNSSYPVDEFRLPAHPQAYISQTTAKQWSVSMSNRDPVTEGRQPFSLDQDIMVYWRLASDLPGSVDMMTYRAEGQKRGTFMMTMTPGNDLEALNQGRDWIVVLDYSGSMEGKYQTLLQGVREGFQKFSPNDRVKVIVFSDRATVIGSDFTPAIPSELEALMRSLELQQPGGGTNLYAALDKAMNELDSDRTSAIWLVTDGVANVGETQQQSFLSLMNKSDVRLFTFIMGNGANTPLLTSLTRMSNGFAIHVSNSDDIGGVLLNAASKVNHQSLRDIKVEFSGVKVADVQPVEIGSLYRGQQLVLFGHYWGEGELAVELNAKRGTEQVSYSSRFDIPSHGEQFPELERLWAFSQIETLLQQQQDYGQDADRQDAIVDLAVEYGLVTDYTSMLVVEDDVFDALGIDRRNSERIAREQRARENRANNPLSNTRVDADKPMFDQPRATYANGSGGSLGIGLVLFVVIVFGYRKYSQLKLRLQQMS
ncbi:VIT and VWA domain-containing protein [Alteromonas sp. ASW11-36]|uniref:VIT and VWA domain-containing protein n=1 Tax=Alteromonas arenosi TaxID=3055817 RepID=A0ABT7SST8_9ALTE|nr:VIT and VWA domain-containing protein [Alteromonas sp. ASW11-36]MDM7859230.1 VIT and VWA domain-containing protein [Alteromonas sp. ASW11-36]